MGASPSRCMVVEDSVAGVTAAKSAGMTCVGFTGGSHCMEGHAERLYAAGADAVVDRLDGVSSFAE
jgi:beta-phosphoglucomutase-like phosphatase (HAD superfamily)